MISEKKMVQTYRAGKRKHNKKTRRQEEEGGKKLQKEKKTYEEMKGEKTNTSANRRQSEKPRN